MGFISYSDTHFTDEDQRVGLTVSSEDNNFLAQSIYKDDSRGSTWRTSGYWLISSSNNTIVFDDGSGAVTATITSGEYNSDTAFFTEIKTQMESVGANTYTIARDSSTYKISISSDTTGFEILWTNVASNTAALLGFDPLTDSTGATLVNSLYTYTASDISLHTEEFLVFDFGSAVNPKFFAALGPSDKELPLSGSATIKLMFNNSSSFTSPAETINLTYNKNGIYEFDSTGLASTTYRYMKFQIVDPANAFGTIEFSKIVAGSTLTITQGAVQFPLSISGTDLSSNQNSFAGQSYGQENGSYVEFSLRWFGLNSASKEALQNHFYSNVKTFKSYFVFLDPDAVFSSSSEVSFYYVKNVAAPTMQLVTVGPVWEVVNQVRAQL